MLSVGRLRLQNPFDFNAVRPEPLVPRMLTREITERIRADGEVVTPIDLEDGVREAESLRSEGVQAVAISFLNAYRNDAHERAAADAIRARFPDLYVCTSGELWPQIREYERTLVSVINGYVGKRISEYLTRLRREIRAADIAAPVFVTKSNGGVATAEAAAQRPVELLLSGPAAGVVGAAYLAQQAGFPRIITIDIGGTSADLSIVDGAPIYSSEAEVGEFPVTLPAVDITAIGAGGGSVAWLDPAGVLKVGPRSAGADPGPACYGLGSLEPTITDAYLVLGIVDETRFLSGSMPLRRDLAVQAIATIAERLHRSVEQAAEAILEVATSTMYRELMSVLARRGVDPADFALFVFGGAGATHSFLLAEEIGFRHVVVPPFPGVLCALGALVADVKRDFIRTQYVRIDANDAGAAVDVLRDQVLSLERQALAWVQEEGLGDMRLEFNHSVDMRYVGQSFEVEVQTSAAECSREGLAQLLDRFHQRHLAIYGYSEGGATVEVINVRTTAIAHTTKPRLQELPPTDARPRGGSRRVFQQGAWHDAVVYRRDDLGRDARVTGPAVIEQYDTTTFVPLNWQVRVDKHGNLVGERG
jgi:N-methylhydantoinase A